METITPPPQPSPAHDSWRAALRQVLAYRDRYQITDPLHPLGPEAGVGERGDAYAIADRALETITTGDPSGRAVSRSGRRPMERVPVVLAEARAHAARMRHEADERARRDHLDRERERTRDRTW